MLHGFSLFFCCRRPSMLALAVLTISAFLITQHRLTWPIGDDFLPKKDRTEAPVARSKILIR